ncbi:MAG: MFS transporter [Sphingomonas sp.]|uniref:spinster family MFS transporter n=1 Tax=Sphingomonas sp. TaxID=28214 RepID=UPI0025E984F8|nr:MFS transporter [Sphingomonas sp.]MBY0283503.1 MFS transporter [Sphingomonas sp.]
MATLSLEQHVTADARALRLRGWTLALLTLVYFFSFMDRYILSILLEAIKADLQLNDTQLGLLSGFAFAIFYATLGIPVAWLADRTSRRDIIAVALTLWSAMTALCGTAANFTQLLIYRIGVGVGEAGSSPPSHSIIADLYPPEKRAGAMGIYSTGVVLGGGFGAIIGGLIAQSYGWRWAMAAVGLPGILLAVFVRVVMVEPRRGLSDPGGVPQNPAPLPSLSEGLKSLGASAPAIHLIIAVTITSLVGYATTNFGPSYLQRSFGMTLTQVSLYYAPAVALIGAFGGIMGGRIADRLGRRYGLHVQAWFVAVLKLAALPFTALFYLSYDVTTAFAAVMLSYLLASSYLGPSFALIQGLAPTRMRAVWAAITLLVINLIGLGLGPSITGILSDLYKPAFGAESLRYAMLSASLLTPWAIYHYWRAGVLLKRQAAIG